MFSYSDRWLVEHPFSPFLSVVLHVALTFLKLFSSDSSKQFTLFSLIHYVRPSVPHYFSVQLTSPPHVPLIYGWVCAAIEDSPLQVSHHPPPRIHTCTHTLCLLPCMPAAIHSMLEVSWGDSLHTFALLQLFLLFLSPSFCLSPSAENGFSHNWVILSILHAGNARRLSVGLASAIGCNSTWKMCVVCMLEIVLAFMWMYLPLTITGR